LETFPTLDNFLATTSVQIPLFAFLLNLLLTALLAAVLGKVYIRFGNSLSNRRLFARNFVLLAMTVMLIITIVKSSLALSLGLVGALSIVRYRAAIKEPEELGYLFVAITLGLGMGANQTIITVIAFLIIVAVIWLRSFFRPAAESPNLHLTVSSGNGKVALEDIINTLRESCTTVSLKRFDETEHGLEATFFVEYSNFDRLEAGRAALRKLDSSLSISLLDNKGLV
jgi:hypothetical protein